MVGYSQDPEKRALPLEPREDCMSAIGKILLTMCDNDLQVNPRQIKQEHPWVEPGKVLLACMMLGLKVVGGS